jgi:hypothetical protein
MAIRRNAIRLSPDEDHALRELYLEFGIPADQYEKRPEDMALFIEEWSHRTGRSDAFGEVIHYIRTQRKQGLWVRFDGSHKTAPSMLHALPATQRDILVDIYREHVVEAGFGSDNVFYDPDISRQIATEFFHRTRRRLPEYVLVAVLTALRKRGRLPVVGDRKPRDEGLGFSDINKIPPQTGTDP